MATYTTHGVRACSRTKPKQWLLSIPQPAENCMTTACPSRRHALARSTSACLSTARHRILPPCAGSPPDSLDRPTVPQSFIHLAHQPKSTAPHRAATAPGADYHATPQASERSRPVGPRVAGELVRDAAVESCTRENVLCTGVLRPRSATLSSGRAYAWLPNQSLGDLEHCRRHGGCRVRVACGVVGSLRHVESLDHAILSQKGEALAAAGGRAGRMGGGVCLCACVWGGESRKGAVVAVGWGRGAARVEPLCDTGWASGGSIDAHTSVKSTHFARGGSCGQSRE